MKKRIALCLAVVCVLVLSGCHFNNPTFQDFDEYSDAFTTVRDFILDCGVSAPSIVYLNDDILTISDNKPTNETTLLTAVQKLQDKGFSYVWVRDDHLIFWEDETKYYGVLWSLNPKKSIREIKEDWYSNMKSRKLTNEWYEIGALDAI